MSWPCSCCTATKSIQFSPFTKDTYDLYTPGNICLILFFLSSSEVSVRKRYCSHRKWKKGVSKLGSDWMSEWVIVSGSTKFMEEWPYMCTCHTLWQFIFYTYTSVHFSEEMPGVCITGLGRQRGGGIGQYLAGRNLPNSISIASSQSIPLVDIENIFKKHYSLEPLNIRTSNTPPVTSLEFHSWIYTSSRLHIITYCVKDYTISLYKVILHANFMPLLPGTFKALPL